MIDNLIIIYRFLIIGFFAMLKKTKIKGIGEEQMKRVKNLVLTTLSIVLAGSLVTPESSQAAQPKDVYQIEVSKSITNAPSMLYLYKNGKRIKAYPVATGANKKDLIEGTKNIPAKATPEGTFPIVMKTVNPQWKDVPGVINGKPNPNNPLGVRWHGLNVHGDGGKYYGIHGTNVPSSIGKQVSNGCIRMHTKDVVELFNLVPLGTPVWIHTGPSDGKWRGRARVGSEAKADYSASFPGRDFFRKGKSNKYVYQLGVMLQRAGYGKYYRIGPSNTFTEADRRNVQAFQLAQGWRGKDADGYPGPETWKRLVKKSKIMKIDTTNN
jgi:lipoprotein-anchoring transpeptidase ErfK/SrfK